MIKQRTCVLLSLYQSVHIICTGYDQEKNHPLIEERGTKIR